MTAQPNNFDQSARVGVLDPVRRRVGLAYLAGSATIFALADGLYAAGDHWLSLDCFRVGEYFTSAAWACLALAALIGASWSRVRSGARPGDSVVLLVGGVALALVAVSDLILTLCNQFFWPIPIADSAEMTLTAGHFVLGSVAVVLAVRYGRYRSTGSGRSPLAALLISAVSLLCFIYADVYGTSWFQQTTNNNRLAGIMTGVAYAGLSIALVVAASLHLGPGLRLVLVAAGLLAHGVARSVIDATNLSLSVDAILFVVAAVGALGIGGVLLFLMLETKRGVSEPRWAIPAPMHATPSFGGTGVAMAPQLAGQWLSGLPAPGRVDVPIAPATMQASARFCSGCGIGLPAGSRFCAMRKGCLKPWCHVRSSTTPPGRPERKQMATQTTTLVPVLCSG
jgi:hypothetical protein